MGNTRADTDEDSSAAVKMLVMQARMMTLEAVLMERSASGRTWRRLQVKTWASVIPGRSRTLKGLMFGPTLESPTTVKSKGEDMTEAQT